MRLISFLGTGIYDSTKYAINGEKVTTKYVACALASIFRPTEIMLIATDEAWATHGDALSSSLSEAGHPCPERVSIPTGGEPDQLWKMFGSIVEVIRTSDDSVLLDITHGFRSQPFFAAACIQYIQSVLPNPPKIRVVYAEFRKTEPESPIWELTPFLEVLSWSRSLMMFLRTGQADEVVKSTDALGRQLDNQLPKEGRQLRSFGTALGKFSNNFTTIRTGSMLTGKKATAQSLDEIIDQTREEVAQKLPALRYVLDEVSAMVKPLRTDGARLSSTSGQRALVNLAKLYQSMGRYSEACSIIREGWITLGAPKKCDHPGDTYDKYARKTQEEIWQNETPESKSVSDLRNDIQHAGFNKQPKDREWFERQITTLMDKWEAAIDASESRSHSDHSLTDSDNN